jgi:hypothetical protein
MVSGLICEIPWAVGAVTESCAIGCDCHQHLPLGTQSDAWKFSSFLGNWAMAVMFPSPRRLIAFSGNTHSRDHLGLRVGDGMGWDGMGWHGMGWDGMVAGPPPVWAVAYGPSEMADLLSTVLVKETTDFGRPRQAVGGP